ncbi:MAG: acyltransferase [Planctomycetota bacterium]
MSALVAQPNVAISETAAASENASSSVTTKTKRILELDALRAIAAINLVLFHFTWVYAEKFGYSTPLGFRWPFGSYGVEMFFILSGFVNSMSLLRRGKPGAFVSARLIRIVPLFMLAIGANVWILQMDPMHQAVEAPQLFANFTLMPRVLGFECFDPVMWTLQVEMMFYLLLVTMFKIGALRRYMIGWGTLLLISYAVCPWLDAMTADEKATTTYQVASTLRAFLLLDFVPLFSIGFCLYMIKTKTGMLWANIAGVTVSMFVFHSIDHGKHNPAATLLIIGLVTACAYGRVPPLRFKPLVFVSTISYALYLCHNNLGSVLIHRFDAVGIPPLVCFAIAIAFSFSLAILLTRWIEQPVTAMLRRRFVYRVA